EPVHLRPGPSALGNASGAPSIDPWDAVSMKLLPAPEFRIIFFACARAPRPGAHEVFFDGGGPNLIGGDTENDGNSGDRRADGHGQENASWPRSALTLAQ